MGEIPWMDFDGLQITGTDVQMGSCLNVYFLLSFDLRQTFFRLKA
jgi:hypothetical protein